MPNSLRKRVKKMAYKGEITSEEAEKIRLALDKQIPMKPIKFGVYKEDVECPNCKAGYLSLMRKDGWGNEYTMFNHCGHCGKRLDWSK